MSKKDDELIDGVPRKSIEGRSIRRWYWRTRKERALEKKKKQEQDDANPHSTFRRIYVA